MSIEKSVLPPVHDLHPGMSRRRVENVERHGFLPRGRYASLLTTTLVVLASLGQTAQAQDALPAAPAKNNAAPAGEGNATGGDIIVTATKRTSASLKDVPIAVTAFSASTLAQRGALDFKDFYHNVPGLSVQDYGPGDKRYVIRGVNATGAGTVGLYLDEMIVTGANSSDGGGQQPDIKLFDIDRVEVLKGPQGTTFGSSSLSGTIRYITAKPDIDNFAGVMRGGPRITQGAGIGYQADGTVNIPVIPGRFALRVSGYYQNAPGYIENIFEKGANGEVSAAGRVMGKLLITDNLTLNATFMVQNTHQDSKGYIYDIDYAGADLSHLGYYQADTSRAPWDDNIKLYNATLDWKRNYGTFTATASRFDRRNTFAMDASLSAQAFYGLPYEGAGRSTLFEPTHRKVDSYEVRFASDFKGPFQILVGAFLQQEDRHFSDNWISTNAQGYPDGKEIILQDFTHTTINQKAVFGEASYQITDRLKFTAGARWFHFKINQDTQSVIVNQAPGSGAGDPLSSKDGGLIGRFNLAYKLTDQMNVYAQAAQGFRSGGANDALIAKSVGVSIPASFGSDNIWNYEAGAKADLFDHLLYIDAAVYYIDWSNVQIKAQATDGNLAFAYTANGGGAHIKGFEIQAQIRPLRGLSINGSVSYSDARLSQNNPSSTGGVIGDQIPYVPKWQLSGGGDYNFAIGGRGLKGLVGFDVNYTSKRNTDFDPAVGPTFFPLAAYALANVRTGVKKDDWSATVNVTNLFNNNAAIDYTSITPGLYPPGRFINQPRTYSLNVSKSF